MRSQIIALAACAMTASAAIPCVAAADEPRRVVDFNDGWLFQLGDPPDGKQPGLDDSSWRSLRLPHDWSIEGAFDRDAPARGDGAFLPTGVAWCRKRFATPDQSVGKLVLIEFDGVMANSDVWLNGRHLGRRPSGYVGFRYDLTPHLRRDGGENVLAVRADTSAQPASRWYTGSGVYREVRLIVVDKVHIPQGGVLVTTPRVTPEEASVACSVEVENQTDDPQDVVLLSTVIGPAGQQISSVETTSSVDAGAVATLDAKLTVPRPELWDVGRGVMYRLVNRVLVDGQQRDSLATEFGVRTAGFRAATGFWINGRNVKLKGVCLHHCAGAVGAAVPRSIWEDRLTRLQDLGVNAIRTSHNPPSPGFLDACDQLGLLVMDEFFDCWHDGKRKHDYHLDFDEWAHRDLRDSVRRDRNHPSVILYSVGNEIRDTHRPEHARRVLAGLVEVCHAADPSRPVTQGLFRPNVTHDYDNGLADLLDVIGTNYRTTELLDAWRDDPTRKIVNTEQGHDRGHWLTCRDNAPVAGQFLWVGIDYLGESRRWPVTTFDSGLLDRTGCPHPRGYERQSWWSDKPMVRAYRRVAPTALTPADPGYEEQEWRRPRVLFDDWTPGDNAPGQELVEVYSNCDEVELLLNGDSLGAKPLPQDARPRQWRVTYAPGELVAIGRNEGTESARHTLRTAGPATRIELTTHRSTLANSPDEVAIVEARLVDEHGVPAAGEERNVTFSVDGPGGVIAVDNGSITSLESFRGDQRKTHLGRCVAIVAASADKGKLTLTATAEGVDPGSVTLEVTP